MRTKPTIVMLGLLAFVAGCTSTEALPASRATFAPPGPATLRAGDVVEFKFPYAPELNDTQRVRPDGRVSLQLVGEVEAGGRMPGDLAADLEERYARHLKQPQVTVVQREDADRRIFVAGEVRLPGVVPMPVPLDAFEAVTLAGGFDLRSAAVGHVLVMRDDGQGRRVGYRVDMRPVIRGEATAPFRLQAGDHVFVPRTAIVNVNQFVEQYVGGVIPNGLRATRNVGNTTYGVDTSLLD